MNRLLSTISISIYSIFLAGGQLLAQELPPGFILETVTEQLDLPTSMFFAKDGRILISEKSGKIRVIEEGVLLAEPMLEIETQIVAERGLQNMVLHPDFDNNPYVYFYYIEPDKKYNQLARAEVVGNTVVPGSIEILFESDEMWAGWHNGGAMFEGPGGKLMLAQGDGTSAGPKVLTSALGKVLRFNWDGSIPDDNPLLDQTEGKYQAIYAYGFRNPYTMSMSRKTGKIFVNDVGTESYEEVNEVKPGQYYGWSYFEGPIAGTGYQFDNYEDPIYYYDHDEGCAVVGSAFYEPDEYVFPEEYHDKYFFMDYCEGWIKYMDPETHEVKLFATGLQAPSNLFTAPDGDMYILHVGFKRLSRLKYIGLGEPYIFEQPVDMIVPAGADTSLSVGVSGDELSFEWFRNGVSIGNDSKILELSNMQLSEDGDEYYAVAFNEAGSDTSQLVMISVVSGSAPEVNIEYPHEGVTYSGGDTIWFKATATDEANNLDNGAISCAIDFHHNTHKHPAFPETFGLDSGYYVVGTAGEVSTNVWHNLVVKATDADGLSTVKQVRIDPVLVEFDLNSTPKEGLIRVDGIPYNTPAAVTSVNNITRIMEAPKFQVIGDSLYLFQYWEDDHNAPLSRPIQGLEGSEYHATYDAIARFYKSEKTQFKIEWFKGIGEEKTYYKFKMEDLVDFNFNILSPWPWDKPKFPTDSFSAKITGTIFAPVTAEYTFTFIRDGVITFTLDEDTLMKDVEMPGYWGLDSVKVDLVGGQEYEMTIDYTHLDYISRLSMFWSYFGTRKHLVTSSMDEPMNWKSDIENTIMFYPNPTNGEVVKLHTIVEIIGQNNVMLYNNLGQLVSIQEATFSRSGGGEINVSNLDAGIYIARIIWEDQVLSGRLIIGKTNQ